MSHIGPTPFVLLYYSWLPSLHYREYSFYRPALQFPSTWVWNYPRTPTPSALTAPTFFSVIAQLFPGFVSCTLSRWHNICSLHLEVWFTSASLCFKKQFQAAKDSDEKNTKRNIQKKKNGDTVTDKTSVTNSSWAIKPELCSQCRKTNWYSII